MTRPVPPGTSAWAAIGRAAAGGARRVAHGVSEVLEQVDPDLRRHLAQLPAVGLTHLAPRVRPVEALPDDGHPPLVLVHGLAGHPGNFLAMRAWLALRGRRRVYAVDLGSATTLDVMAVLLRDYLQAVVAVNGLDDDARLDLVAHSMGGIVARLALEDPDTARRIRTLVTLASPHAGTYMANLGGRSPVTELRPDAPVMDRLARQLPWRAGGGRPRLVAFWSAADRIVVPGAGGRVEGAENVEMPGFTHYSWFMSPSAWRRIEEALR